MGDEEGSVAIDGLCVVNFVLRIVFSIHDIVPLSLTKKKEKCKARYVSSLLLYSYSYLG